MNKIDTQARMIYKSVNCTRLIAKEKENDFIEPQESTSLKCQGSQDFDSLKKLSNFIKNTKTKKSDKTNIDTRARMILSSIASVIGQVGMPVAFLEPLGYNTSKNNILKPDRLSPDFCNVNFNELSKLGYHNLIIDIDNTLAPNSHSDITKEAEKKISDLKKAEPPFNICLVSNTLTGKKRHNRVKDIAQKLGVPYVAAKFFNAKPGPQPFEKAMNILGSAPENTAVIGDQLFTDIQGGNSQGMFTVLLSPFDIDDSVMKFAGVRKRENKALEKQGIFRS